MAEKRVRQCWECQIDHCPAALGGGENCGAVRTSITGPNLLLRSLSQLLGLNTFAVLIDNSGTVIESVARKPNEASSQFSTGTRLKIASVDKLK